MSGATPKPSQDKDPTSMSYELTLSGSHVAPHAGTSKEPLYREAHRVSSKHRNRRRDAGGKAAPAHLLQSN